VHKTCSEDPQGTIGIFCIGIGGMVAELDLECDHVQHDCSSGILDTKLRELVALLPWLHNSDSLVGDAAVSPSPRDVYGEDASVLCRASHWEQKCNLPQH
jgi:hypothetical protein